MEEKVRANNGLVLDVEDKPKKIHQWLLFAVQHVLAMLVACITVPLIMQSKGYSVPVGVTIISAGLGTIIYLCFTKFKSPVFLSSSFAYLAPMESALAINLIGGATGGNFLALILGMVAVGIVYVIVGLIVRKVGTKWLNKVLPVIVVGPVIIVIGLGLAASAVANLTNTSGDYQIVVEGAIKTYHNVAGIPVEGSGYSIAAIVSGLVALLATAFSSHYGKGMIKLIPFIIGMLAGYVTALLFTAIGYYGCGNVALRIIDFTPFENIFGPDKVSWASFFNYNVFVPNHPDSFVFLRFDQINAFDWSTIGSVLLLFVPVAFVTMCEHIGDHENLGNILQRDLLNNEPGMNRTLMGDGVATAVSGALCGAANTTYGENVAVVGLTRIASSKVVLLAAFMSIVFGLFTPFTAFLTTIPNCVTGGVSLILYGFIASSGIKMMIKEKVDLTNTKNIFVISTILVSGIGGLSIAFTANKFSIEVTSVAISMILGIILNLVLVNRKNKLPKL